MNTAKSVGIYRLSLDLQSLEVIARASYFLTLRDRKQRNLQQVVASMLESTPNLNETLVRKVDALRPFVGETILSLRLDKQQQAKAEFIKIKILNEFGFQWLLRDLVVYLCRSLIEDFS